MPEFFEVKRIKDYLNDTDILTIPITSVSFKNHGERILKQSNTDFFREVLINNCIQSIQTKAKYTFGSITPSGAHLPSTASKIPKDFSGQAN